MARTGKLGGVVKDARLNAVLSWLLVAFLLVVVVESVVDRDLLWAGFTLAVVFLALVPAVAYRSPKVMLPWEVLIVAILPILGRSFATLALTSRAATYLSVAAVALIVAVELHVFTAVRMTHGFAVVFVAVATMASAGIWAVAQWLSYVYLGTNLVAGNSRMMWGFVWASVAGIGAGVLFDLYFRTRAPVEPRLPDEVGGGLR